TEKQKGWLVSLSRIQKDPISFTGCSESLGMIIFVFTGLSAAIGDPNNSYPDQEIKVAFAFGLAIATLAQCIGHVSGAHLNPAITLGLLVSYKRQTEVFSPLLQLNGISPYKGYGVEFLLTLQLVLCVLAVTDKRCDVGGLTPLAIGLSVALGHLAGVRCGINPARSFGPAIILESFDDHWVYWAGPMSAGVVAALLYNFLLAPRDEPLSKQTRVLFCCSSQEKEIREPLLEDVRDCSKELI
uniref:Aquaporin 1a (Colton blood group), tandem duplicate 2 n=1 Tax=Dicentrarchus labrax TaxID=13489 RepID=A0A8P4KQ28_DICLA